MAPYRAPLADIRFVLRELNDLASLSRLPDCEALADADLTDTILEHAARFAAEVLARLDRTGDRHGARWTEQGVVTPPGFPAAYRDFVDAGWHSIDLPAEYGGQGLPAVLCSAVREMFVAANKAFCMCPDLIAPAVRTLEAVASEPLKSFYIPKLVSGTWTATMNLTESSAGSDVGALRTRAEPHADGSYRLYGQKIFITFGDHDLAENIVHLVLARIREAPEGSRGISLFLVPKILPDGGRNDLRCTGIEHKLGNHASPTCTLAYGAGGAGATGWLVGRQNHGLESMFVMMNGARFNVGVESIGVAERAYQQALAYAKERVQGRLAGGGSVEPVSIIRHPDVRRMLLAMRSQIEAMRAVASVVAAGRDRAERHPDPVVRQEQRAFTDLMIPVFKGWASETSTDVASLSIQVHGGVGYVEDAGATQPLRDVRITTIYEGTTGIQAQDLVERKLVRDDGQAFRAWTGLVHATLHQLEARPDPDLQSIAQALRRALAATCDAADSALQRYRPQPLEVLAGSVPLLRAFGIVAGGWQMARAALVAHRHLEEGRGDATFLRAKLTSSLFYATHVLPQAIALAATAIQGGAAVLAMEEAAF